MKIDLTSRHIQSAIEAAKSASKLRTHDPETAVGALRKFAEGVVKDIANNESINTNGNNLNSLITILYEQHLLAPRFEKALRRLQAIGNAGLHIGPALSHREVSDAWIAYEAILAELPSDVANSIHARSEFDIILERQIKEIKEHYDDQHLKNQKARDKLDDDLRDHKIREEARLERERLDEIEQKKASDNHKRKIIKRRRVFFAYFSILTSILTLIFLYRNYIGYAPNIGDSVVVSLEGKVDIFSRPQKNEKPIGENEGIILGTVVSKDSSGIWMSFKDDMDMQSYIYLNKDVSFLRKDQDISKFQKTTGGVQSSGCFLWKVHDKKRILIGYRNRWNDKEVEVQKLGVKETRHEYVSISYMAMNYAGNPVTFEMRDNPSIYISESKSEENNGLQIVLFDGVTEYFRTDSTIWRNRESMKRYKMIIVKGNEWSEDDVTLQCHSNVQIDYEIERRLHETKRINRR